MNSPETTAFTESGAVTTGDQRKMDAPLKAKWVEALRSGKYAQGTSYLKRYDAFCCLGVLCEIQSGDWDEIEEELGGSLHTETLPEALNAGLSAVVRCGVAKMNDSGKSFPEIADYIEQNL